MNQYSTTQLIGELVKRLEAEGPQGCNCCDDLAGLPTDDAALAFVSSISMGGTGDFTPVQDHELDDEPEHPADMLSTTFVVREHPTHDPAIIRLHGTMLRDPDGLVVQVEAEHHCYKVNAAEEVERMREYLIGLINGDDE